MQGCAVPHLIVREIFRGNDPATLLNQLRDLAGHCARVEVVRAGLNPFQRTRELRLPENVALAPSLPVVLKDPPGIRKPRQNFVFRHRLRRAPAQRIACARQRDSRFDDLGESELAKVLLGIHHPLHRAGNSHGPIADDTEIRDHLSLLVLVHGLGSMPRRLLSVVEKMGIAGTHADEHKTPAADVTGLRIHHCKRKTRGYSSIDRVAPRFQRLYTGPGSQLVNADHHRVRGVLRMHRAACQASLA